MAVVSRLRHELARRRWIYRSLVAGLVLLTLWAGASWSATIDAERARWGDTTTVLVARTDLAPGTRLAPALTAVDHPVAVVPDGAVAAVDPGTVARRSIPAGGVVTDLDVGATAAPQSLLAPDQVAVAVTERIGSGARVGDRVMVATDGVVVAADATVVGTRDDVVLVAVATHAAPAVAAAANGPGGVSLLLLP